MICSVIFLISQSTLEAHVKRHYYAVSVVNTCSLAQQVTASWHIDDVTLTQATTDCTTCFEYVPREQVYWNKLATAY